MIKRKVWERRKTNNVSSDRRLIGCKWVFKRKRNGVYRARLVALGYSQIPGIDFTDNYSPVIQDHTFRILCVLMLYNDWRAEIVDIETAYLYGELEEVIYMKLPDGHDTVMGGRTEKNDCMKLVKTIYGLFQAARQFFKKLAATLTKIGFTKSIADQCLFFQRSSDGTVVIAVYIDDTLCIGDEKKNSKFKQEIRKYFVTKEEGEMTEYVGCEVVRKNRDKLVMKQSHLIGRIRKHFNKLTSAIKKREILLTTGFTVQRSDEKGEIITAESQHLLRSGIGMLLYLVKFSRPDISNAVKGLSKANAGATNAQFKAMLRAIKYALDIENVDLSYKCNTQICALAKYLA